MNICIVSPYIYPLFNETYDVVFGGAEIQLYQLAKLLSHDTENNVICLTADFGQNRVETYDRIIVQKEGKVSSYYEMNPLRAGINKIIRLCILCRAIISINADYYVQRSAGIETVLVGIVSRLRRRKFVYMIAHDDECNGNYVKNRNITGILFELGMHLAHCICTQTNNQKQLLHTKYPKLRNAVVLQSGYEIPEENEASKEYVLWVGRMVPWKKIENIIAIAKEAYKRKFIIIAPIAERNHYTDSIEEKLRELDNVTYEKRIPFSKIDEFFKNALVYVNTSEKEGFPNTFIQAAKYGIPILSMVINPDNILEHEQIGIQCKSKEEIIHFIEKFANDDSFYKKYAVNGPRYVKNNHNIEDITERFSAILQEI